MTNIFDDHLPPLPTPSSEPSRGPRSNKRRIDIPSAHSLRRGAIKLEYLAELAFDTLEDAMEHAEYPVAVQAARLALDRSGYGPSSTLKVEDGSDLSSLSTAELIALSHKLGTALSKNNQSESESTSAAIH